MTVLTVTVPDEYSDIQQALDFPPLLPVGGTYEVKVRAGTYSSFVVPNTLSVAFITIRGCSKPIIDGSGSDYAIRVLAPDVTIEDLEIRAAAIASVAQDTGAHRLKMDRVTLRNSPKGYVNLDTSGGTSDLQILNTEIFNTILKGIDVDRLAGEVILAYITFFQVTDLALGEDTVGIRVQGPALTKVLLRNSIVYVRKTVRDGRCIEMGIIPSVNWEQENNCFFPLDGATLGGFSPSGASPFTNAKDLAAWQTLSGRDVVTVSVDPLFEDEARGLFFLRHHSPVARTAVLVGLADPSNNLDNDWSGVIRAVDGPSIGAHEVHDVVSLKAGAQFLGIGAGLSGPIDRVALSTEGLEDDAIIFRPLAFRRAEIGLGNVIYTGGKVTGALQSGQLKLDAVVGTSPREAPALTSDRKIFRVSELGLTNKEGEVITARRIAGVPFDPLLPFSFEFGTRLSVANAKTSPVLGIWEQLEDASGGPGVRDEFGMAYDSSRNRVVVFGGWDLMTLFNDVREFDPVLEVWTKITTINPPSPRRLIRMVYNTAEAVFYMFGGFISDALDETWKLDPSNWTWTKLAPATVPPARWAFGMAYDVARGKVVIFGGHGAQTDTWEFDGTDWTEFLPAGPPGRAGHFMEYDSSREGAVVFGGNPASMIRLNDMWFFDGAAWTQLQLDGSGPPGKRSSGDASFDSRRDRLLLFGSSEAQDEALNSTHEWLSRDNRWFLSNEDGDPGVPSKRHGFQMVYVSREDYHFLYGGETPLIAALGDFWKYHFPFPDC